MLKLSYWLKTLGCCLSELLWLHVRLASGNAGSRGTDTNQGLNLTRCSDQRESQHASFGLFRHHRNICRISLRDPFSKRGITLNIVSDHSRLRTKERPY